MRRPIISGNWKMNKTPEETVAYINEFKNNVKGAEVEVILCPPAICLTEAVKAAEGTNVKIAAQNMHYKESGAFTGELSPLMLKSVGIEHVVIGHSERRQYFNETDETVNLKLKAAFENGIVPILCIGETLEQRESGRMEAVLEAQLKEDLAGLTNENVKTLVIAYEPIWAIGTGKTASAQDANDTIKFIRNKTAELFDAESAEAMRILYGGSVNPSTIKEQMGMSDIDGGLVGGASLKVEDFSAIVNY